MLAFFYWKIPLGFSSDFRYNRKVERWGNVIHSKYLWNIEEAAEDKASQLAEQLKISLPLAKLLWKRKLQRKDNSINFSTQKNMKAMTRFYSQRWILRLLELSKR